MPGVPALRKPAGRPIASSGMAAKSVTAVWQAEATTRRAPANGRRAVISRSVSGAAWRSWLSSSAESAGVTGLKTPWHAK
jgi:hypothetical protein